MLEYLRFKATLYAFLLENLLKLTSLITATQPTSMY